MNQFQVQKLVANKEAIFKNMQTPTNVYGFILALHPDSLSAFGEFVGRFC